MFFFIVGYINIFGPVSLQKGNLNNISVDIGLQNYYSPLCLLINCSQQENPWKFSVKTKTIYCSAQPYNIVLLGSQGRVLGWHKWAENPLRSPNWTLIGL